MRKRSLVLRCLGMITVLVLLPACGGEQALAPLGRQVKKPSATLTVKRARAANPHRVLRGESLYAIAWIYGLDYRDIAAWNRITEPYTIFPGQRLVLRSPVPHATPGKDSRTKPPIKTIRAGKTLPRPVSTPIKVPPATPKISTARSTKPVVKKPTVYTGAVVKHWRWPAKGKLIGRFNKSGGKGINIQGRRGQPVYTAAAGRVVYSGSGLRGYGKLIIIKHNKHFLSAYAHNQQLQVQEGDTVKSGQQIAQMGDTESRGIKLHFEIRRDGKPVNPTQYLP